MTGILLINLGTPDKPETAAVRRYLRQFLSDPRVIDIHPVARFLLLNLIILPFRSPKSAEAYRKIWLEGGSPLLVHGEALRSEVSKKLGADYAVELGMRYGNPSLESALKRLAERGVAEIRALPLYPQYSLSATGSSTEELSRIAKRLRNTPPIHILPPFFDQEGYLGSFVERGKPILSRLKPDHVLFSFHGLPERHILKGDPYKAQCIATGQALAERLGLKEGDYSISFQSRLGRTPWIRPYTDLLILDLAGQGKKRLAVFCPAFVADCLETLEEIGIRARESFLSAGGEALELVPSLNTHLRWVEAVCGMVR